jgi:hypothetical protein
MSHFGILRPARMFLRVTFLLTIGSVSLLLLASPACHAQTTITNIDDDPITSPNDTYNDNRAWAWETGQNIGGCVNGVCHATAALSHVFDVTTDGEAMRLDLNKINDGCTTNCWTDAWYGERIYHNVSTANGATTFTLDVFLALDSRGISHSQAVEFNMEQDFQDSTGGWSIYKYSWQCDYKGTQQWRVWDSGTNQWVAIGAACVVPFNANGYDHYVFHATRLSNGTYSYSDFFVNGTHVVVNYTTQGHEEKATWENNLFTWIQLDSDGAADSYTAWVDQLNVTYQ